MGFRCDNWKRRTSLQAEFMRLNLTYTISSKRGCEVLWNLVLERFRRSQTCYTIRLRRRGVPSSSIVEFGEFDRVAKVNSFVDIEILKHAYVEFSNEAKRVMCVGSNQGFEECG